MNEELRQLLAHPTVQTRIAKWVNIMELISNESAIDWRLSRPQAFVPWPEPDVPVLARDLPTKPDWEIIMMIPRSR